jgi:hypothetical protein
MQGYTSTYGLGQDTGGNVTSPPETVSTPVPIDIGTFLESQPLPTLPSPTIGSPTPVSTVTPSSTGTNLSSLLNSIVSGAAAGEKLYLGLQTPSLIPGTSAIYNPATGQTYNPLTGQVIGPGGTSVAGMPDLSSLTAYLPQILLFGGLGLAAILLINMMGRR